MAHNLKIHAAIFLLALFSLSAGWAQSYPSAGSSWGSSYAFPTANDRSARNQGIDLLGKAEAGAYDNGGSADGSARSGVGGSYVAGAVNNSTSSVYITGNSNTVTIGNSATSTGCQDGRITVTTESDGSIDISAPPAGASPGC